MPFFDPKTPDIGHLLTAGLRRGYIALRAVISKDFTFTLEVAVSVALVSFMFIQLPAEQGVVPDLVTLLTAVVQEALAGEASVTVPKAELAL